MDDRSFPQSRPPQALIRPMLEERGLLKPIGVVTHPRDGDGLPAWLFNGEGLEMSLALKTSYEAAESFSRLYAQRQPGAGFLKTMGGRSGSA